MIVNVMCKKLDVQFCELSNASMKYRVKYFVFSLSVLLNHVTGNLISLCHVEKSKISSRLFLRIDWITNSSKFCKFPSVETSGKFAKGARHGSESR